MDWKTTRRRVGVTSAVFLVGSLIVGAWGLWEGFNPHRGIKVLQAILLGLWILLPPIWFWGEYFFLYQNPTNGSVPFDEFKHGQEQSAKIWLALITVLAGLYFGKDLVRECPTPSPQSSATQQSH